MLARRVASTTDATTLKRSGRVTTVADDLPAASPQAAQALTDKLGVTLDPELLVLSLTHRSFAHEAGGIPTNERLEFLGDSVLGIVVTEALFRRNPDLPEGALAKMRAASVSQRALASVARELDLGSFILLGKGERLTGGREKDSILSDTLEAIFGAVYLSYGLEPSRVLIERLIDPVLARAARMGAGLDWKTSLQERAAELGMAEVVYTCTSEGPDHARRYSAQAVIGAEIVGYGEGTSKKLAEQEAAAEAYHVLETRSAGSAGD